MNEYPIIKKITFNRYQFPLENMRNHTLSWVYKPGSKSARNIISIKIDTIDSDGYVTVSEDPGLGVEYDYDYAKKFLIDSLVID